MAVVTLATPETAMGDILTLFRGGMHRFYYMLASPLVIKEAEKE